MKQKISFEEELEIFANEEIENDDEVGNYIEVSNRNKIRMSNELNNAIYNLSAIELDIVLKMIAEIRDEYEIFKEYKFKVLKLEKFLNKRISRSSILKMVENMKTNQLIIKCKNGEVKKTKWFSSFEYDSSSGCIFSKFSDDLKPHLLQLKSEFLKADIKEILKLDGYYAKRIFLLGKQWESVKILKTKLEDWQDILQVPESSRRFGIYRAIILDKSVNQIKEKTNYNIGYVPKKDGRAYTHLMWRFKQKTPEQIESEKTVVIEESKVIKEEVKEEQTSNKIFNSFLERHKKNDELTNNELTIDNIIFVDDLIKKGFDFDEFMLKYFLDKDLYYTDGDYVCTFTKDGILNKHNGKSLLEDSDDIDDNLEELRSLASNGYIKTIKDFLEARQ